MDVEDLMIGDWVQSKAHNGEYLYTRIKAIDSRGENKHIISSNRWIEDDAFHPIPLTIEILEKNGWKKAQFWHEYQDGNNTIQSCLPDMRGIINGVEIPHFKCEYVHQYQHLLRLCGMEELANSFKV